MPEHVEPPVGVDALEFISDDGSRYEVIEGELYISGHPGIEHQNVLGNLLVELKTYLNERGAGQVLLGVGIVLNPANEVIPDLLYVSNERLDQIVANERLTAVPEIVVEILSAEGDEWLDRNIKRKFYSSRGVDEYWLVDPESRTVEIARKRKQGGLETIAILHADDELTSPVLPDFRLPISRIFE